MVMQDFSILYSIVPSLGAVALSVYNFYKLREGGKIRPLKILNYGLWTANVKDRKVKNMFLPIILDNYALKSAMVTNISIFFSNNGQEKELTINRKIDLQMPPGSMSGMDVNQFRINHTKELVPFYPITVPGQESVMCFLDCTDREDAITVDQNLECKIVVEYGSKGKSSIKFPFLLSSKDFDLALDRLRWFKA